VLTAAHCFHQDAGAAVAAGPLLTSSQANVTVAVNATSVVLKASGLFGLSSRIEISGGETRTGTWFVPQGGTTYDVSALPQGDIALVKLSQPVTDIPSVTLGLGMAGLPNGTPLTVVGTGGDIGKGLDGKEFDAAGVPVWSSHTGIPGSDLEAQDDGNFVIYAPGHIAVWATGTSFPNSVLALNNEAEVGANGFFQAHQLAWVKPSAPASQPGNVDRVQVCGVDEADIVAREARFAVQGYVGLGRSLSSGDDGHRHGAQARDHQL